MKTDQESDQKHLHNAGSGKLLSVLYSRHRKDFWAYLNLFFSTITMYLSGHAIAYPYTLSWVFGWMASEFGQVHLLLQALNLYTIHRFHPDVFSGWFGRLALLVQGWSGWHILSNLLKAQFTRQEFTSALQKQNIPVNSGETTGRFMSLMSLLPLFYVSRRGKPLTVQRNIPYANMKEIDPNLLANWQKTSPGTRTAHQVLLIRGRISRWLSLDLWKLEQGLKPNAPMYIHIHGGGWMVGDKKIASLAMVQRLASRGVVCVSINYRMAPEKFMHELVLDCKRALIYCKSQAASWGCDPNLVFVGGESAGGHLSALLGVTPNLPDFQPPENPHADTSVAGTLPLCGVFDIGDFNGNHKEHRVSLLGFKVGVRGLISRAVMQTPHGDESRELYNKYIPTTYLQNMVANNQPKAIGPFFIPHGTRDTLAAYEDSVHLYEELQRFRNKYGTWKAGESDVFVTVEGAMHAFGYFPSPRAHHMGDAYADFIFHHSARIAAEKQISGQ